LPAPVVMPRSFWIVLSLSLSFPALAGTSCQDWWVGALCITLPDSLELGALESGDIDLSDDGVLNLSELGPKRMEVSWQRSGWLSYLRGGLYLQVTGYSSGVRLGGVGWRRVGQVGFNSLPPVGEWVLVKRLTAGEFAGVEVLEFRYLPDVSDPPGAFRLELELVLVTWAFSVVERFSLTWSIPNWCALAIPASDRAVDLGEILPDLYDVDKKVWTPLESSYKRIYVATNGTAGVSVTVQAFAIGPATVDLSRFTISGGDLHEASLDAPRTLYTASVPGVHSVTDIVYRYRASWDDPPGRYMLRLLYTATAP